MIWVAIPTGAVADGCALADDTQTCSGDLSSGVTLDNSDGDFDAVDFEDLTATAGAVSITSDPGPSSSDDGAAGNDVTGLTITFDGSSSYGISNDSGAAFSLDFTAGEGNEGKSKNGSADDGGDGGSFDGATGFTVTNATDFTGLYGMDLSFTAGNGGKGGEGSTTVDEAAHAGDGGDGGDESGVTITIETGDLTTLSATGGEALFLQSVGGDGGKGGEGKGNSGTATNVHGGDGGDGGAGGDVKVTLLSTVSSSVATEGLSAIRVESIGGSGGDGGEAKGSDISAETYGGDGGSAAAGGDVTLTVETAELTTTSDLSLGILARSYGGAGGDGGSSSGGFDGSGGGGKSGGLAGDVTASFGGTVMTSGTDSTGILLQSVGGYAGDAGSSQELIATYGASDESGGQAGDVIGTVVVGSSIQTGGDGADGVYALSVGGGGGKGTSTSSIDSLGGSGSAGGDGGTVTLTLETGVQITTGGDVAAAVSAQSYGGGGGSGGSADGISSVGGSGGSGGDGKTVTVSLTSVDLTTSGESSNAVMIGSSGGGGGVAKSTTGVSAIGGSGGDGGDGGNVILTLDNSAIRTYGDDSDGIHLQSVGGGGGKGANSLALGVGFSQAIGGSGGDGGTGGDVTLTSSTIDTGFIVTTADRASGVYAQSIGGGGGASGNELSMSVGVGVDVSLGQTKDSGDGNVAGTVTIDSFYHSVETSGDHAYGVLAQSVGGGGGSVGTALNYAAAVDSGASYQHTLGGSGGTGGNSDAVSVTLTQAVSTQGDHAHALFAQSLGGGGGNSGTTLAGNASTMGSLSMTTGGSGGAGGNGGTVTVSTTSDVSTSGSTAYGIFAQSVGGGGGNAGWTANNDGISDTAISLTTGGDGGAGGTASDVSVTTGSATSVSTEGDSATAILAQSVGGSGGNAAATASTDISSGSFDLGITTGGDGGGAGDPGKVTVASGSDVTTQGDSAHAILAQSIANTGGNAAFTVNADLMSISAATFTVSGSGGDGGNGGQVTVTNGGTLSTSGDSAVGILAQSNGSGGGSAKGTVSVDALTMVKADVAVGGNGGTGGSGGDVEIDNSGMITTQGSDASAIFAQSQGGAGGAGGMVFDGGFSAGTEVTADVTVTLGGDGGSGAAGGDVTVNNLAPLATADYGSYGIFAQSLGGSGGSGGSVYSGNLTFSAGSSFTAEVAIGGNGGDGGSAGDVAVNNFETIDSGENGASAIFAQSVSGDGGTGGYSLSFLGDISKSSSLDLQLTVGGKGGGSSNAGDVTVINSGALSTTLGGSSGIYAQSIGGNGGAGGSALTLLLDKTTGTESDTITTSGSLTVGGEGGDGGVAGAVEVLNTASIATQGDSSYGIFTQSVGGGGGDGGAASFWSLMDIAESDDDSVENSSYSIKVEIGGNGGTGGEASSVSVTNTGSLSTAGRAAYGIFAQSVGGGGGVGGNGDVVGSALEEALNAAFTAGDASQAQSTFEALQTTKTIGEDLYNAYSDFSDLSNLTAESFVTDLEFVIGGSGGTAGSGAAVKVESQAPISTSGISATAIYAQSIGGGGGTGGDGNGSVTSTVTLGGNAGSGSDGGTVAVNTGADVSTSGLGAMGIFAQSVGGGGGVGGDVEFSSYGFTRESFGVGAATTGSGGKGGDGGDVTITTGGKVTTTGEAAHAIWAQSVGGGGGAAASYDNEWTVVVGSGSKGSAGDGGAVTLAIQDDVTASGNYSWGIFAQSVSGNDGKSSSSKVSVDIQGDIAVGDGGHGVTVQSEGSGSSGEVLVTLNEGYTLTVGKSLTDADSYGILNLDGDGDTTINVYGDIAMSSIDDIAVGSLGSGDTQVNLTGSVFGSVYIEDAGSFYVSDGGLLEFGSLEVGLLTSIGSVFLQDGTLSPGGEDNIVSADVYGAITTDNSVDQAGSGVFLIDLEMGDSVGDGTSDAINFTSSNGTNAPSGSVDINLIGSNLLSSGESDSVEIFTTDASGNSFDASNLSIDDTATVDYEVSVGTSGSFENITVTYTVDYSPDDAGLTQNQKRVGDYVSALTVAVRESDLAAETGEGASSARVSEEAETFIRTLVNYLLTVETFDELKRITNRLGPGEVFAPAQTTVLSSLRFADKLHSCPRIGVDGIALYRDEGSCLWGDFFGGFTTRGDEPNTASYDESVFGFAGGAQKRFEGDWILGGAFSYERSDLSATDYSADGHRVQAGLVLKKELGDTTFSGSFSGGFGTYNATRNLFSINGNTPSQATSDPSNTWIAGHARVSHSFQPSESVEIVPYFDLGVWQFWQGAYDEGEGKVYGLEIDGFSSTSVTANPMVEVSGDFDLLGMAMNANARGGVLAFLNDRTVSTEARLLGAGSNGPWFTLNDTDDRVFGQIGAGLQGQVSRDITLEASFDSLLGGNSKEYVGSARLNFNF
ncbi:MAG: autotransporter [Rhodospirillales bacterium]